MAKARLQTRETRILPRSAGDVVAFPRPIPPVAVVPAAPAVLATSLGAASFRQPDPASILVEVDLDAGSFFVGGARIGVRAPFVYSEASDAFVIAFSSEPICWTASGRLARIDVAFAAVDAIQDALAILVHEQPRLLALARIETMARRLVRLDADLRGSSDASRRRMRDALAAELVVARRALLVDASSLRAA
jgi:hypothetical protein